MTSSLRLFTFEYPPKTGGIGRLCSEFRAALERAGVQIALLPDGRNGRRPFREARAFRALRGTSLHGTLCGIWYPEGLLALLAGARPLIVLTHGNELLPTRARWRRGLWARLRRRVLESADLVVANSRYTAERTRRAAPASEIEILPPGVNIERFRPGDRVAARAKFALDAPHVITTVARVVPHKGHDTVLTALARLSPSVLARITYLLAGEGPAVPLLRRQAEALGITDRIRWLGAISEDDLPDLYRASDLFVMCAREDLTAQSVEGFGLVFLEAQASGVPVIGTRAGGIPDAIKEGQGGWLIAPGAADALAWHFTRLVEGSDVFRAAGQAGRRRVEQECTWDHYAARFLEALAQRCIETTGNGR